MDELQAFPMAIPENWDSIQDGMTLRDYFAGQALTGISSDPTIDISIVERAEWSYRMADAMLEARGE